MLADNLIARAQRCTELQHMLDADPGHKDAPAWIAEISQKALNRHEDRHVAIVRSVRRIRQRIASIEARAQDDDALRERIDRLQARIDSGEGPDRLRRKLDALRARLEDPPAELHRQKLPALRRRLDELCASHELLTREDVIDG